jgi:hypothetical protein
MTICVAKAAIEDGGYQPHKFTYIKKLLEWYKRADPSERGVYIRRSLALALSAWDRHLAVASAVGNGGEENEHWEVKKNRFDLEFAVDVGNIYTFQGPVLKLFRFAVSPSRYGSNVSISY